MSLRAALFAIVSLCLVPLSRAVQTGGNPSPMNTERSSSGAGDKPSASAPPDALALKDAKTETGMLTLHHK